MCHMPGMVWLVWRAREKGALASVTCNTSSRHASARNRSAHPTHPQAFRRLESSIEGWAGALLAFVSGTALC